jgi:hypothetical protein
MIRAHLQIKRPTSTGVPQEVHQKRETGTDLAALKTEALQLAKQLRERGLEFFSPNEQALCWSQKRKSSGSRIEPCRIDDTH